MHPDKTGDESIVDLMKRYVKERDEKPGNVFLGVVHRIDRPVSGVLILTKTSKALSRLSQQFKNNKVDKYYWAITEKQLPATEGELVNHLGRNKAKNLAYISKKPGAGTKKAKLRYWLIGNLANMFLWEVKLETGRHHQIRAQLGYAKSPIIGDVKYGYDSQNDDLSICLHAKRVVLWHPVKKELLTIDAPLPKNSLWQWFTEFDR